MVRLCIRNPLIGSQGEGLRLRYKSAEFSRFQGFFFIFQILEQTWQLKTKAFLALSSIIRTPLMDIFSMFNARSDRVTELFFFWVYHPSFSIKLINHKQRMKTLQKYKILNSGGKTGLFGIHDSGFCFADGLFVCGFAAWVCFLTPLQ